MTERRWPATRDTDAAVARVLGWEHVELHPTWDEYYGFSPMSGDPAPRVRIPHYATADEYDSDAWGEMIKWLNEHAILPLDLATKFGGSAKALLFISRDEGQRSIEILEYGITIGHALACAVLSVAEQLREGE